MCASPPTITSSDLDAPQRPRARVDVFNHLRRAKHLAIIEVELIEHNDCEFGYPRNMMEEDRKVWKRGFIGILKDSPSKNRKLFRWRTSTGAAVTLLVIKLWKAENWKCPRKRLCRDSKCILYFFLPSCVKSGGRSSARCTIENIDHVGVHHDLHSE